eukprot:Gb_14316 [translate_table: standard]
MSSNTQEIDLETTLTFDGVTKNNLGFVGVRGCLSISKEKSSILYTKGLDRMKNNLIEYVVVIKGLKLAKSHGVKTLLIQDDSEMLINQLSKIWTKVAWSLEDSFDKAQGLLHHFEIMRYRHIFQNKNQVTDLMANTRVKLIEDEEVCKLMSAAIMRESPIVRLHPLIFHPFTTHTGLPNRSRAISIPLPPSWAFIINELLELQGIYHLPPFLPSELSAPKIVYEESGRDEKDNMPTSMKSDYPSPKYGECIPSSKDDHLLPSSPDKENLSSLQDEEYKPFPKHEMYYGPPNQVHTFHKTRNDLEEGEIRPSSKTLDDTEVPNVVVHVLSSPSRFKGNDSKREVDPSVKILFFSDNSDDGVEDVDMEIDMDVDVENGTEVPIHEELCGATTYGFQELLFFFWIENLKACPRAETFHCVYLRPPKHAR